MPPWELAQKPVWWTEIALTAQAAEAAASNMRAKRGKKAGPTDAHGGRT